MPHRPPRGAFAAASLLLGLAGCTHAPPPAAPSPPLSLSLREASAPPGPPQAPVLACAEGGDGCAAVSGGGQIEGKGLLRVVDGASAVIAAGKGSIEVQGGTTLRFLDEPGRPIELVSGAVTVRQEGDEAPALRVRQATAQVTGQGEMFVFREGERAAMSVPRGKARVSSKAGVFDVAEGEGAAWRGEEPPMPTPRAAPAPPSAPHAGDPPGVGTMTARLPNTQTTVPGVRLASHDVRVFVRDGFARTEIEEVFQNETDQVLEGRYVFSIPEGGSVSRLALWVEDRLIEGEVVEKNRAQQIYSTIVDDKIRPRDPALLDWVNRGTLSLRVFPIPARGSRRVLLAYNQALRQTGGELLYTYPFARAHAGTSAIGRLGLDVVISETSGELSGVRVAGYPAAVASSGSEALVRLSARDIKPDGSLELRFSRKGVGSGVSAYMPSWGEFEGRGYGEKPRLEGEKGFLAARVKLDAGGVEPRGRDVVVVLDASHRQSPALLDAERRLALATIASLGPGDRYALLACDSACRSFPEQGLAPPGARDGDAARFLQGVEARGSHDLVGAIRLARKTLGEARGQILYAGGSATSGEVSPARIQKRLARVAGRDALDLRLVSVGEPRALAELARALGVPHEPFASPTPPEKRAADLASWLRAPVVTSPRLVLPPGVSEGYLHRDGPLLLGDEAVVFARFDGEPQGEIAIEGSLAGRPYRAASAIRLERSRARQNPLVPRLWAERVVDELDAQPTADERRILDLSRRFHIMSRRTSFLVLESEQMFSDFGVERTTRHATDQSDQGFSAGGPPPSPPDVSLPAPSPQPRGDGVGQGIGGGGIGRLGGEHRTNPPQVRMGATTVSGRLPPEIIQRIVRRNFGRFRLCYENGLRNNPDLQGRISVRFVIGRDGNVMRVSNGGSDLPDGSVVSCVVRSFSGLSFPQPEGGIVTVTYPIFFSPGVVSGYAGSSPPRPLKQHIVVERIRPTQDEETSLKVLAKAAESQPTSRAARESFVRGLLVAGKLDEALVEARRLAEIDVESASAHTLLAQAAAATGDVKQAALSLDVAVALAPSADSHHQAAHAFELAGDEPRACAHFRAASDLWNGSDDALAYQVARCRLRLGDDPDDVRAVIGPKQPKPSPERARVEALLDLPAPAYDPRTPAESFEVTLRCHDQASCPTLMLVSDGGSVRAAGYSQLSRVSPQHIGFQSYSTTLNAFRVMVSSPARGTVTIKTPQGTHVLPLVEGQRRVARVAITWK